MATVQEKTNILRNEFLTLAINHDEYLTLNQLQSALNQKARKVFDQEIFMQLYERMGKDHMNKTTIDEFIKVWINAEQILKNKIETCKKYLEDFHRQKKEAIGRVNTARIEENVNQYGVMEKSTLTVELIDGVNFPHTQFFVLIKVQDQTEQIDQCQGQNPQWNLQFQFLIYTGMEELQIFFATPQTPNQKPNLLGTVTMSLTTLADQNRREVELSLYDKDGNVTKSKIRLCLQWVYSNVKYLNEAIENWNENIRQQENDLLDFERDLAVLYEPFPNIVQVYQSIGPQALSVNQPPPDSLVMTPIYEPQKSYENLINKTKIITLCLLVFSILSCFQKAQYLDILICFAFIGYYENNFINRQIMFGLVVVTVFSIFLDMYWLTQFSYIWWNQEQIYRIKIMIEQGSLRIQLTTIYMNLILKIGVAIAYFLVGEKKDGINLENQILGQINKSEQQLK